MSRFIFGDDLGNIKVLRYLPDAASPEEKASIKTVHSEATSENRTGIQRISTCLTGRDNDTLLATGSSNGCLALHTLSEEDELNTVCNWTEKRLKDNYFVGLTASTSAVYSCTSNGALRRATFSTESSSITQEDKGSLPTRLRDWKLSSDAKNFAYGGEEVDLSVWDAELAFQAQPTAEASNATGKKRRRADTLFHGEVWRAKNLPNDSLSLRQPVRITSLSFLPNSGSGHSLVTGTLGNDVRRYDTRAARRPVADWKVGKVGGIKTLQAGLNEHELFVSDQGTNLYAVDLRNGQILYGYPGIAGAVTSIAVSPTTIASTSLDRYVRTHTIVPPAGIVGTRLDTKGAVSSKTYTNCIPICIVWDGIHAKAAEAEEDEEDDVWDEIEEVSDGEDSDDSEAPKKKRRNLKS
ncbi:WD40-repeat-containing domain protein [Ephemerocybe angulata]|uniref:Ribosome biogenesis protein NSA1 n=1 Tax=Ephemerocybe angulata TaxID=980116 RepID=A0A8H6IGF1_9AGAR|nr:WD40-repeat-containing domain protein [Tulosesus angulatus]